MDFDRHHPITADLSIFRCSGDSRTHCSADRLAQELSYRKDTENAFLQHDAEPEYQKFRYAAYMESGSVARNSLGRMGYSLSERRH